MKHLKILFLSMIFLSSPNIFAAENEKEEKIDFQTEVDPKAYSPKEFEKNSGYKTTALKKDPPPLSTREERNLVFSKVKDLEKQITGYDHLAKDMLFYRAKSKSINELTKLYPEIPESILKDLQKQFAAILKTKK
jgi:hypothetical protein